MIQTKKVVAAAFLAALFCQIGFAQGAPPTILVIDVENQVVYNQDVFDVSKFATDPNITTRVLGRNFAQFSFLGDIVAVNGQPVKGTHFGAQQAATLRTAPTPGQGIGDTGRDVMGYRFFDILNLDGTLIGSIVTLGAQGGPAPPGAPLAMTGNAGAIVGGTGAFLGVRGQAGQPQPNPIAARFASITEDPANRRTNGGGRVRVVLQVIPMFRPEIVVTPGGPAVTHSSDFSLVTASKPAAAGETLSAFVTGLGPTRPGVDPGKPFPASPPAVVNSPVEVTVNGRPAEVLAAVGYPGAVDSYQVNFRVPSETARGTATVQVTAAWIAGPEVRIAVQ